MAAIGLEPGGEQDYFQGFVIQAAPDVRDRNGKTDVVVRNVVGRFPGAGPLADESIVVGAHLDHLGDGPHGVRPRNRGRIHPGADDNASGVAGLLLVAESLGREVEASHEPRRTVIFVAFAAEEPGLLGSRQFVASPPTGVPAAAVVFDMIGRLRDDTLELDGADTSPAFQRLLPPLLERAGLRAHPAGFARGRSDHAALHEARIPALLLSTGLHTDYHRPSDTPDKVDPGGALRVTDLATRLVLELATLPEPPRFAEPARPDWSHVPRSPAPTTGRTTQASTSPPPARRRTPSSTGPASRAPSPAAGTSCPPPS